MGLTCVRMFLSSGAAQTNGGWLLLHGDANFRQLWIAPSAFPFLRINPEAQIEIKREYVRVCAQVCFAT